MTSERDFQRAATEWLDAGSDSTPQHVIDAVLLAVRTTPQDRDLRIPWRLPSMRSPLYSAAAVAVILLAVFFAIYGSGAAGPGNVTASPTEQPTPGATPRATPAPTPIPTPIDTTVWDTYQSQQYGFTIGYPPDWSVVRADHDWSWARDGYAWLDMGMEAFMAPASHAIAVSAWPIPLERGQTIDSVEDIEAWVADYCQQTTGDVCTGIHERATPMCLDRRACLPALIVPFESSVQAFFSGGSYPPDQVMVVSVWWPDDAPAVRRWGGSIRLLQAFLSTMGVCPTPDSPDPRSSACSIEAGR